MSSALSLLDALIHNCKLSNSSLTSDEAYEVDIDNPQFNRRGFSILCCGQGHPYAPKLIAYLNDTKKYNITLLDEAKDLAHAKQLLREHIIDGQNTHYDAVLNVWVPFRETLKDVKLPNLKCVSFVSSGFPSSDFEYCQSQNVRLTNVPYALNETVADLAVGLTIATCRHFYHCTDVVKKVVNGETPAPRKNLYTYCLNPNTKDVHHSVVGIVGLGAIGKQISKRLSFGFDCKCLYFNGEHKTRKIEDGEYGATFCASFESLVKQSDIVIAVCPLNGNTKHMFNRKTFQMMKNDAVFINVGRGGLCDHNALIEALKLGWIGAAGLDVQDPEPLPSHSELWDLKNCVILPHIGSATQKTRNQMFHTAVDNMLRVLHNLPCRNIVC